MEANSRLAGRTALVTGAAKRLGRAIAIAFAQCGADVVVHYGRSRDDAEETVDAIKSLGRQAWALSCDLAAPDNAAGLIAEAWTVAGGLDLLVNNASVFPEGDFAATTLPDIQANLDLNAFSPFALSRAFARRVEAADGAGDIVNLLDCRMVEYDHRHVAYHISKRVLFDLTRMMALEFAPRIKVNGIAPGLILPPEGKDETYLAELAHTNPLQRYGRPDDIADAAVYLAAATFITGQVIYVDGGRHVKGRMYG